MIYNAFSLVVYAMANLVGQTVEVIVDVIVAAMALCALAFILGAKALKGLGVVGKAGKNIGKVDIYRYVPMKGLDKAIKSGSMKSASKRGTFVTTHKTGSASEAMSRLTPLKTDDIPVARLHGRVDLNDYKLNPLDERDIIDMDIDQYLLGDGPDIELLDWEWLGP